MPQKPIGVGIIGLGLGGGEFVPGMWAIQAHLPYLTASPNYKIVAVQNSTKESAQASIDHHNLGPSVAAYGTPDEIATDPNVDLIIVSVKVTHHYALTKPALEAGKDVFVEWPLGASVQEAKELSALAASKKVKTIVGLQTRASLLTTKLRTLISSNAVGKILSSTVTASLCFPSTLWPKDATYYLDANSGGNSFTIYFGHFLDSFTHVLGGFDDSSVKSILKTVYPTTTLINPDGTSTGVIAPKSAPDHIFVLGTLKSGALASISLRNAPGVMPKAVDGVGWRWMITGTEGEILVEAKEKQWQALAEDEITVKLIKSGGEVEVVTIAEEEPNVVSERAAGVKNVARIYEAFLEGDKEKFADFEGALGTHKLLEEIKKASLSG